MPTARTYFYSQQSSSAPLGADDQQQETRANINTSRTKQQLEEKAPDIVTNASDPTTNSTSSRKRSHSLLSKERVTQDDIVVDGGDQHDDLPPQSSVNTHISNSSSRITSMCTNTKNNTATSTSRESNASVANGSGESPGGTFNDEDRSALHPKCFLPFNDSTSPPGESHKSNKGHQEQRRRQKTSVNDFIVVPATRLQAYPPSNYNNHYHPFQKHRPECQCPCRYHPNIFQQQATKSTGGNNHLLCYPPPPQNYPPSYHPYQKSSNHTTSDEVQQPLKEPDPKENTATSDDENRQQTEHSQQSHSLPETLQSILIELSNQHDEWMKKHDIKSNLRYLRDAAKGKKTVGGQQSNSQKIPTMNK
jgi:hypothetical protein